MLKGMRALGRDLMICIGFYSRLPIGALARRSRPWSMADFARAARLAPLAGLILGGLAGCVLMLAAVIGLSATIAAGLAITTLVAASGALHEDGLADVADGFGGGRTRERKLEIMRDSRIGTFGATALILSLGLRVAALMTVVDLNGTAAAAAALMGAAAASRGLGLVPLWTLRPARPDGVAHAAGRLPGSTMLAAAGLAVAIGVGMPLLGGLAPWRGLLACLACAAACCTLTLMSARQIGGQTGDVAGAAQQAGEIAYVVVLSLAPALG